MRVYEIEAFKLASHYLFGIEPTKKEVNNYIQAIREQPANHPVYLVFHYQGGTIITLDKHCMETTLPGYVKTNYNLMLNGAKGRKSPFTLTVTDTKNKALGQTFSGVYGCGDFFFTSRMMLDLILEAQHEQRAIDLKEQAKLAQQQKAKAMAQMEIETSYYLPPETNWDAFIKTHKGNEPWRENLSKTRR